jgi:hypothetical protein
VTNNEAYGVKKLQEFGNTLVALGLLRVFFCFVNTVEDIEAGCKCGYCRYSRTMVTVTYITNDGVYFEDEVDI